MRNISPIFPSFSELLGLKQWHLAENPEIFCACANVQQGKTSGAIARAMIFGRLTAGNIEKRSGENGQSQSINR
jgi:hypothetical protein